MRTSWLVAVIVVLVCAGALGCGGATASATRGGGARASRAGADDVPRCVVSHAPAEEEFEAAETLARDGDAVGAQRLFAQACDIGNPCACTEIGESFVDPPDASITRDVERGATLLDRGCQGGDVWGCYALGHAIWRFLPDRIEHARDLYDDACDDGIAEACAELGRFRVTGIDGDRSERDALRLYDRACREGVQYACVMLGEAYAEGVGTSRDPGRAAELLTWACDEAEVPRACAAWADMLDVDDEQRGALLRRACDGGDRIACDELDPAATRMGGEPALRALASSTPEARPVHNGSEELEARIGGQVDLGTLGLRPTCVGFVASAPSTVLRVPEGSTELRVRVHAPTDTVLAIRDPEGRWICADDGAAGVYDAAIEIGDPVAGEYLVWGGAIERTSVAGHFVVDAIAPEEVAPAATYESLPAPAPETVAMPTRRVRFYYLELTAMPGLEGRVRLDGEQVWTFDANGGNATLDSVQCSLGAGRHTLDLEIVRRARDARVISGEGGLLHVALHGLDRPGLPGDESRLWGEEWSPEEPARRQLVFTVSQRQAAQRTAACRE